jgi:hypothetical protein
MCNQNYKARRWLSRFSYRPWEYGETKKNQCQEKNEKERRDHKSFSHLSREGAVPVQQDGQHLLPRLVAHVVLLGAGLAHHHRVHRLEVRGVGHEGKVHALAVDGLTVIRGACGLWRRIMKTYFEVQGVVYN